MRINKLCPKCGTFNQMELQSDEGTWQVECLLCSMTIPIPESEIPKGLIKAQYRVADIPSPTECTSILPIPFGYYRPSIKRDARIEEE